MEHLKATVSLESAARRCRERLAGQGLAYYAGLVTADAIRLGLRTCLALGEARRALTGPDGEEHDWAPVEAAAWEILAGGWPAKAQVWTDTDGLRDDELCLRRPGFRVFLSLDGPSRDGFGFALPILCLSHGPPLRRRRDS